MPSYSPYVLSRRARICDILYRIESHLTSLKSKIHDRMCPIDMYSSKELFAIPDLFCPEVCLRKLEASELDIFMTLVDLRLALPSGWFEVSVCASLNFLVCLRRMA
ncbi:unnamed protein product [Protopolystoma xenopodis]|uniref:Uncharacterized protein n=1 Tax=Protopolystoma xenopodis TaxID=117903 RepID=A0A448WWH4_9PLAT|nr:unnamed protein product [Protopolystoma xenopodis]